MSHYPRSQDQSTKPDVELEFSVFEQRLLNEFQHQFPLSPTPFIDMAEQLGVTETEVLNGLEKLKERGAVSRVGPVLAPNRVGVSTLVAMHVPQGQLLTVAEIINSFVEVNHNYEREDHFNLWFVVTATSEEQLVKVLTEIEKATGFDVMNLPMLEDYHIDLGFDLQWT